MAIALSSLAAIAIAMDPYFVNIHTDTLDLAKFPTNAVNPSPYKKYPKLVQVVNDIPNPLRKPDDLQKGE